MSTFDLARVVDIHPGANAVDVLLLRNGQQIPMVQVLCDFAGTNFGSSGFAKPTISDPQNKYVPGFAYSDTVVMAVVGYVSQRPVVFGFLFPQVSQMLFDALNLRIKRDPSDVYTSVSDTGDVEFYHPSGTFLRISPTTAHQDLTGMDLDGKWAIANNTTSAPHVHLEVHNAGGPAVATLDIDPSGNAALTNSGTLNATTTGNTTIQTSGNLLAQATGTAEVEAQGAATLKSAVSVTIDAPATTITGTLTVDGAASMQSTLDVTGNVTGHANVSDSVRSMAGDRTIYNGHAHGNVQNGSGFTADADNPM